MRASDLSQYHLDESILLYNYLYVYAIDFFFYKLLESVIFHLFYPINPDRLHSDQTYGPIIIRQPLKKKIKCA